MSDVATRPGRPPLVRQANDWLERVELVTPAMCGHNSLFIGQLGDWTWDAVGASCQVNPFAAVDPEGNPVYLSFTYFRVRASTGLCAEQLTFGDHLRVRSKVVSCGGDSVLTVHQVMRDARHEDGAAPDLDGFFRYDAPGSIHVENFNRWIRRSGDHNSGLVRSTPAGFRTRHLDRVPDAHTPRRVWSRVRREATFREPGDPIPLARLALRYPVNASRDLNGVGLLYFASYFSVVDWAVLSLWRNMGRSAASFLRRLVLDRQLCFYANADADDTLRVDVTAFRDPSALEVFDVTLRHQDGRLLAVSRMRINHVAERRSV